MTNLYIDTLMLRKEAFLHASREQLGTWLLLNAYCAEQENGGRIRNANNWAPATWYAVIRSDKPGDSPLWLWHDNDLVVVGYNIDNQKRRQKMSKGGKKGAQKRQASRYNVTPDIAAFEPDL